MMAFAPPKSIDGPKMQTKMSTWTPLNHQLLNDQVFEERRALLGKWFDKWTDSQRRRILTSLLERCSLSQKKFCCRKLQEKIPAEAVDFTTKLPRVLSVYIFSFLDPRRKRNEVNPDFKRQLRDKKNQLQGRARLRKARSLLPACAAQPGHHLLWPVSWPSAQLPWSHPQQR
nr:F-box only protein 16 [Meriones unguiculatus]